MSAFALSVVDMQAPRLTVREVEVLWLVAHGCTYKKVAMQLGISAHTVAAHIKNAYRKLDVHSAGAAVMRAMEMRLLTTDSTNPQGDL